MLICPQCKAKYKNSFFKKVRTCAQCNEKLHNVYTMDDVKVQTLATVSCGNLDKWVTSTLPEYYNIEDLAEVYKLRADAKTPFRERFWLHDILDDHEILYRVEIREELFKATKGFRSSQNFILSQHTFVEKQHVETVKKLIEEYNSPANVNLSIQEDDDVEYSGDDMPQTTCPRCSKQCDTDYIKCPHCKELLY